MPRCRKPENQSKASDVIKKQLVGRSGLPSEQEMPEHRNSREKNPEKNNLNKIMAVEFHSKHLVCPNSLNFYF